MKSYKEMEQVDLKLHLLSGNKIKSDNLEIEPYLIEEIRDYGYTDYMMNLQWLTLTVDDFIKSVLDIEKRMMLQAEKSNLKTFDFYAKLGGQEMLEGLLVALAMIFKTGDIRVLSDGVIAIGFVDNGVLYEDEEGNLVVDDEKLESLTEDEIKLVHRENFDNLVEAIRLQNYLSKPKEKVKGENPADEETRQLLEQMKANEEKVNKAKRRQQGNDEDDEPIDISDIISAVTAKSNSINKLNVWKLTLYQLYDEYARLELIDNYDFSIRAMMAGAEKIDLKHWSSKL